MPKSKKAQPWFDNKYSHKEKRVKIVGNNLEGPLKIENFTRLRSIILKKLSLSSLEISNCSQLASIELSELTKLESLSVNDCRELTKLDCSNSQITELEVSNLSLKELNCSKSLIENLSLNLCPNITKLNCSNNVQLTNIDISNCDRLISHDLSNCSKLETLDCSHNLLARLDLSSLPKSIKINSHTLDEVKKEKPRNLLIMGRTGGGKSTISNVLSGTNNFDESESSISKTKNFRKQPFEWKGTKYRVVDTIGVGDTKLTKKQVFYKIAEGIYSMPEGISQILFVIDGRFTKEETETFELIKKVVFESDILKYVTIVRTKFSNFKNKEKCEEDRKQLLNENKTIAKMVNSCRDIVYVDNPPTNIQIVDDDDKAANENNGRIRASSRKILLDELEKACQGILKPYKFKKWDILHDEIVEYFKSDNSDENSQKLENALEGHLTAEFPSLRKIFKNANFCSIS